MAMQVINNLPIKKKWLKAAKNSPKIYCVYFYNFKVV